MIYHIPLLLPKRWYFSSMVLKFLDISLAPADFIDFLISLSHPIQYNVIQTMQYNTIDAYNTSKLWKLWTKQKTCILKSNGVSFQIILNYFDTICFEWCTYLQEFIHFWSNASWRVNNWVALLGELTPLQLSIIVGKSNFH